MAAELQHRRNLEPLRPIFRDESASKTTTHGIGRQPKASVAAVAGLATLMVVVGWVVSGLPSRAPTWDIYGALASMPIVSSGSGTVQKVMEGHAAAFRSLLALEQEHIAPPGGSELLVALLSSADGNDPITTLPEERKKMLKTRPKKDRRKIGPDLLLVGEGESTDSLVLGAPTWLKLLSSRIAADMSDEDIQHTLGEGLQIPSSGRDLAVVYSAHLSSDGNYKWLLVGEYDTYFVISNVRPLLATLDHDIPYFIALPKASAEGEESSAPVGTFCLLTDPQPCVRGDGTPVAPEPGAGFILSSSLMTNISESTWKECIRDPKEPGILAISACIQGAGYYMTILKEGLLNSSPYNGKTTLVHPPPLSGWPRPLSFHGMSNQDLPPDLFELEAMDAQDFFPIESCFLFMNGAPNLSWKPGDSHGELAERVTHVIGVWALAWAACREIWIPWMVHDESQNWENLFRGKLEGAHIISVKTWKDFEAKANKDSIKPQNTLRIEEKIGSYPATPIALYMGYRLDKLSVSLNNFKQTYLKIAANLSLAEKLKAVVDPLMEQAASSFGIYLHADKDVVIEESLKNATAGVISELVKEFPKTPFILVGGNNYPSEATEFKKLITKAGGTVIRRSTESLSGPENDLIDAKLLSYVLGILEISPTFSSTARLASSMGQVPLLNLMPNNPALAHGPVESIAGFLYELTFPFEVREEWSNSIRFVKNYETTKTE